MSACLLAKLQLAIAANHRHLRSLMGRQCACQSCTARLTRDTGREGIGSARGTIRRYQPAIGTWTAVT